MALDRTNMVSLLDVGKLFQGMTSNILEMGDGYTDLTEDWGPNVQTTQYVNMQAQSSTLSGYEFSMNPEREYLSDEMQQELDKLLKKFPTGKDCETTYYRFFKTDVVESKPNVFKAIMVPIIVAPASAGGEGGSALVTGIQINGNGDVKEGFIKLDTSSGEYTWSDTEPSE